MPGERGNECSAVQCGTGARGRAGGRRRRSGLRRQRAACSAAGGLGEVARVAGSEGQHGAGLKEKEEVGRARPRAQKGG